MSFYYLMCDPILLRPNLLAFEIAPAVDIVGLDEYRILPQIEEIESIDRRISLEAVDKQNPRTSRIDLTVRWMLKLVSNRKSSLVELLRATISSYSAYQSWKLVLVVSSLSFKNQSESVKIMLAVRTPEAD